MILLPPILASEKSDTRYLSGRIPYIRPDEYQVSAKAYYGMPFWGLSDIHVLVDLEYLRLLFSEYLSVMRNSSPFTIPNFMGELPIYDNILWMLTQWEVAFGKK